MENLAISRLHGFLQQHATAPPVAWPVAHTIPQAVNDCFMYFTETNLRLLVPAAMEIPSEQEIWSMIIDAVRNETVARQSGVHDKIQRLMEACQHDTLSVTLQQMLQQGALDFILIQSLQATLQQSVEHKDDAMQQILQYLLDHIQEHLQIPVTNPTEPPTTSDLSTELLITTGEYLERLLQSSAGNVDTLRASLVADYTVNYFPEALLRVLLDNIEACKTAGYTNKLKLFIYIKSLVEGLQAAPPVTSEGTSPHNPPFSTAHTPKFEASAASKELVTDRILFLSPPFDAANIFSTDPAAKATTNNKKKAPKKAANLRKANFLDSISEHLEQHHWVAFDNLLPLDAVRRIRIEAGLFADHYEQSEIWVGKEADVGAHLSVPSVRGDRVLWMCGGHTEAPEGDMSRVVTTIGDIQPCKLTAKAAAPIRKFAAMKELISSCDKLVEAVKPKLSSLNGIFERSDAMLAVYPGTGARFARHIDNTTGDGRRITVLVYLNPRWEAVNGGCLRITPTIDKVEFASSGGYKDYDAIDVLPVAGRVVVFYSAEIPHEVLPTIGADRHAITIWYYDREERGQAIATAQSKGRTAQVSQTDVATQREAKAFVGYLMGGDEVDAEGGNPSAEELHSLVIRVGKLSPGALQIVSSITGAASAESFKLGFSTLTTTDLKSMRKLFRRMGLNN